MSSRSTARRSGFSRWRISSNRAHPCDVVAALFSEAPTRIVASLPAAKLADLRQRAAKAGVPLSELGKTTGQGLVLQVDGKEIMRADLSELRDARERCLEPIVGD